MDIKVTLLGRAAIDTPFAQLSSDVVSLDGDTVAYVPNIPAEAAGQELVLRVHAPDTVLVDAGWWLLPTPDPFVRGRYAARINAARDVPWVAGDTAVFARPGMAAV